MENAGYTLFSLLEMGVLHYPAHEDSVGFLEAEPTSVSTTGLLKIVQLVRVATPYQVTFLTKSFLSWSAVAASTSELILAESVFAFLNFRAAVCPKTSVLQQISDVQHLLFVTRDCGMTSCSLHILITLPLKKQSNPKLPRTSDLKSGTKRESYCDRLVAEAECSHR